MYFSRLYQNLEIIVVDDGSTDDTLQILQKLQHEDHRLKILQQEKNLGAQAARNTGIRAATALYIAFLDSDDEWLASKLKSNSQAIDQSNDKIGVVYAGFMWVYSDGGLKEQKPRFKGKIYNDALRDGLRYEYLVVRKDILYKIGLLNRRHSRLSGMGSLY